MVEVLPRILPIGQASMETAAAQGSIPQRMLPLILALEYAETNRKELERLYPSGQALSQSIARAFVQAYQQRSLTP